MYKIKSRIWIESDEGILLGNGRVKLLKEIDNTGSLSKAAKNLGMSYKKAWNLIDSVNKHADEEVVSKAIGGKDGGGTSLTEYGRKLIAHFEKMNADTIEFLNKNKAFD